MNVNFDQPTLSGAEGEARLYTETEDVPKKERNKPVRKSVQWAADQELVCVMDYFSNESLLAASSDEMVSVVHESTPDEPQSVISDCFPLLNDISVRLSEEVSSSSKASSSQSVQSEISTEEEESKQVALSELITHLEDTAALLRQYLAPPPKDTPEDLVSYKQTHFLLKYQVVLVLFSQMVSILILTLFDHLIGDTGYEILTRTTGAVLQILNTLLVLFATVVLSRQMLKYKVEGSFLAQTYIATVITFAGLYFMIYRFSPTSWEFGSIDKMEESIAISQYIKMIYLSVSAATLCGAANIQPRTWYTTLLLCFQSLVNFVYFASILAQTIGNYHSYTVQVRRSSSMSRSARYDRSS